VKKTPLKKVSKQKISVLQKKLWVHCKRIIRAKYGNVCYTCGATNLEGSNWHTSHFIPKKACGAYLKYSLANLRPACYNCNINLGGNGAAFYRNMVAREGQEYVDSLFNDKNITVKAYDHYEQLLKVYEKL
jgi:5-methylcytosine-specific restriction endonuclease McrA